MNEHPMSEDVIEGVRRRLAEAMDRHDAKAKPLSVKAGLGDTAVRDILKEHRKDVTLSTLAALADALGEPLVNLLPIDNVLALGPQLFIKGEVAAGVWNPAAEWPADDWQPFFGRADDPSPVEMRFGLRVIGDSMNLVYPHGSIVECRSVFSGVEIASGKRVVVIRQRDDLEFEATVKELVIDGEGRHWLVPRTSNPAFQSIALDEPEPGILETRITAVVIGATIPEP